VLLPLVFVLPKRKPTSTGPVHIAME
jgi:hypothetical protein